jgi:aspartyl-tRNA(Asn)/glutamyl-tRNA(Gln) amidotransferase subunit B
MTVAATASAPAAAEGQAPLEAVIGLETDMQLGTASKILTSTSTAFGDDPNTHGDPVVLGMPGTLLVPKAKVLENAVKAVMGWA